MQRWTCHQENMEATTNISKVLNVICWPENKTVLENDVFLHNLFECKKQSKTVFRKRLSRRAIRSGQWGFNKFPPNQISPGSL